MKKRYLVAGAYAVAAAALAAKLLSRPRDIEWAENAAGLVHGERSRFVEVAGRRVHYQEAGSPDAPVVVLIHGFCASNFIWSDVLLLIAGAGFRVIAPDLIGFGFSEKPGGHSSYTIEAQAAVIIGLMNRLQIKRASLVGSSYGGAVASVCALDAEAGQRIERLVLVGAVANDEVKQQPLLRLAACPLMGDLLSPLMLSSFRLMQWRMRKVYAEKSAHLLSERRLAAHHAPLRAAGTHRAALSTLRRWRAEWIGSAAHRIKQPVLLVWGEEDADVPLRNGERLKTQIPNSQLVVFHRCGHLPQEERPQEFANLIVEFCGCV